MSTGVKGARSKRDRLLLPVGSSRHNRPVPTDFLSLFRTLEDAGVRYVVVGGLAVLLHGVDRLTADVDLVIDLAPGEATRAIRALIGAGFRPALPVDPEGLADEQTRQQWRDERGLLVLSFWDPENRRPTVDVFTEAPLDFLQLWTSAVVMNISGHQIRVASLPHLIEIKRRAGRPRDIEDADRLEQLKREQEKSP